jgi:hypothetical protein
MIKLREKAHASLQAFKDGRGSPLIRTVALSDGDISMEDDELAILGGRTRLVGKGSAPTRPPSPVILQESPTSHHPVIPFPLKQGIEEHVHPTVLDYLRTFGPSRGASQPPQPPPPVPAAPPSRSNSVLFATPPLPDAATFFDFAASYPSPPVSATHSSAPHTPRNVIPPDNPLDMSAFPAYFQAFDYGGGAAGMGAMCSPIQLDAQMPEEQCAPNTTPDALPEATTMQNSWQDFIAQFGLY